MNDATASKPTLKTRWHGMIQCYPDPNQPDEPGCGCSFGGETMGDMVADMHRTATYYQAIGYRTVAKYLQEVCDKCGGSGRVLVPARKGHKIGKCNACRNRPVRNTMPDIELKPSPSIEMRLK